MNDARVNELYERAKNALDQLKTVALEPPDDLQIVIAAGAVSNETGYFVNYCLRGAADQMFDHSDEATSR
jgi:hypothetical protein